MAKCDYCGKEIPLPYKCGYCVGTFCPKHRLPENHDCEGLDELSEKTREEGRIYRDVSEDLRRKPAREETSDQPWNISFRFGGEPESNQRGRRGGESSDILKGTFSILKSLFLRRATLIILLAIILVWIGQLAAQRILGTNYFIRGDYSSFLYYLAPSMETVYSRPWTLITSIFVHGGFFHLLINGMVLFFIGSALERRTGRNKFIYLFLAAGILASFAQILVTEPTKPVLGASGAILGLLGALTVLSPRMTVLLFFFIPMPLWMLTLGYGALSGIMAIMGTGGSIGHMAHFTGLVVGLAYGYKLRKERRNQNPIQKIFDRYHW